MGNIVIGGLQGIKADAEKVVSWGEKIGAQTVKTGKRVAQKVSGKLQKKADQAINMIGSLMENK